MTPSKAKKLMETTILIEGIDSALIVNKARQRMTIGALTVDAGQQCWLVRSSDDATRYYVVAWSDRDSAYRCSCGCPAYKQHKHTQLVNTWVAMHRVQGVTTGIKPLPRATDVTTESLASSQHDDSMLRGKLNGNRAFNLYK